MATQFKLDLSYRGIVRLAKKHGIKLSPNCCLGNFPRACVISTIAHDNGYTDEINFEKDIKHEDPSTYIKLKSIEIGFENSAEFWWRIDGNYSNAYIHPKSVGDPRYVAIGERLRAYARGVTQL